MHLTIEKPLYSETYRLAGTPDRIWSPAEIIQPKTLVFDPGPHLYTLDGVHYPSITQIIYGVGLIDFSMVRAEILASAAEMGKAVHAATHYDDDGDLDIDSLDANLRPYLEAWRAFRQGFNPTSPAIVEIKTGSQVYPWTGLQLAAQAILADLPTARRLAVRLKPDGRFVIHEFKSRQDRGVFLSALSVYQWGRNHK